MKTPLFLLFAFFFLLACNNDNQCADTNCQNDGTCIDGACLCQPGYAGLNCEDIVPPDYFLLKRIIFTGIDSLDIHGDAYDLGSMPDIYVTIDTGGLGPALLSTEFYPDANNSTAYVFDFGAGLKISKYQSVIVKLWDKDNDGNDEDFVFQNYAFNAYYLVAEYGGYFNEYSTDNNSPISPDVTYVVEWDF